VLRALCVVLLVSTQADRGVPADAAALYDRAATWEQFLDRVHVQRDRWQRNAQAAVAPAQVERLARAGRGLRLLIVAEDWCADSVNTVPYIATLAASARVEVRVLDRSAGAALMARHRTSDGRTVTPLVIFLRDGRDAGAWIERPAALQAMFRSMADDPDRAREFANRQAWYDADRGRSTLDEILTIAERIAGGR
jgi:Thioredoxin